MIFNISIALQGKQDQRLMPFNYQYPLSSAIHSIMRKSDAEFASFFHNVGYGRERYKLFTFSDISFPFETKGDRMLLLGQTGSFKICFHVPEAAQHFIKGVFLNEAIVISDKSSAVHFRVQEIDNCLIALPSSPNDIVSVVVQPISPLVISGRRADRSAPSAYYSPYERPFVDRLNFSWIQKYKAIYSASDAEIELLKQQIRTEIIFFKNPPIERRITIKHGRDEAQKVRGYTRFGLKLTAPKQMIELALNSGLGIKNSIGMGCVHLTN
jgi:CRISPR-associated endoribonuclease Cas6